MSAIPWWGLPLVAAVFAVAGAATTYVVVARTSGLPRRRRRWYTERRTAYGELLARFERDVTRLRAAFDAGEQPEDALAYVDDVAPALMQVRLLASGPVRSAALAVHLLLQQLHGQMNPTAVPGVRPETHFRELITQVALVMQQFEAAVRDELGIDAIAPPRWFTQLAGYTRSRTRRLIRQPASELSDRK